MKDMHSVSRFYTEITPESIARVESSEQLVENEEILEKDDSEAPRRSKRQRVAKSFGDDFILPRLLQRHKYFLMQMIRKKLFLTRWTRFYQMGLGN
jgi:hypothetical protein